MLKTVHDARLHIGSLFPQVIFVHRKSERQELGKVADDFFDIFVERLAFKCGQVQHHVLLVAPAFKNLGINGAKQCRWRKAMFFGDLLEIAPGLFADNVLLSCYRVFGTVRNFLSEWHVRVFWECREAFHPIRLIFFIALFVTGVGKIADIALVRVADVFLEWLLTQDASQIREENLHAVTITNHQVKAHENGAGVFTVINGLEGE